MNATRRLMTHLTMVCATLAAAFLAQAGDAVNAIHGVAALETVVIAAQRPKPAEAQPVVQWPTVTVIGHRVADGATLRAEKSARAGVRKTAV